MIKRKKQEKIYNILKVNIMGTIIVLAYVCLIAIVGTVYLVYFDKEPQKGKQSASDVV